MAVGGPAGLATPTSQEQMAALIAWARAQNLRVALRGSGCSYGDAACGTGKLVIDCSLMNRIVAWDKTTGRLRAEAGATIADCWRTGIGDGWWPPVVSGTMAPTLGGAVAMNIHGKNAYAVGPIGDHVKALKVLYVDGTVAELTPDHPHFQAIISSLGELAVVLEVELQLKRIEAGELEVLGVSVQNFDELFACFDQYDHDTDYLVAWVDAFAGGKSAGRGLVHVAYQLHGNIPPASKAKMTVAGQQLPPRLFGIIPKAWMWMLLKPFSHNLGMRLINWAKHWSGRLLEHNKRYLQTHGAFHFLLDYVPNWKFVYKPHGLIQHQIFIPKDRAKAVFAQVFAIEQRYGLPSWLAVMKRHKPDRFLLTHGLDGYSMAQDFAVTPGNRERLWQMCHEIDQVALAAGGRFYFAKDATLEPKTVAAFFPRENLLKFKQLRSELDPAGVLATDLYDRAVAPALEQLGAPQ
ncbi:MAG: FAD-binding oxidoreductase [Deltaproteobacteria bacterium]|nr:FAD-binding oxidoreductase [Deltaproteobacteria bacterium]